MSTVYTVASGFSLSGGTISGAIAVKSFSGLRMNVDVSDNCAGNESGGQRILEPQPGPMKPGQPTFVCPIPEDDVRLAYWWKQSNPNTVTGIYMPQDLVFSFLGSGGEVHAQWQLKQVFPMSYQVSDAKSDSSEVASETIQLCVTEIVREI